MEKNEYISVYSVLPVKLWMVVFRGMIPNGIALNTNYNRCPVYLWMCRIYLFIALLLIFLFSSLHLGRFGAAVFVVSANEQSSFLLVIHLEQQNDRV